MMANTTARGTKPIRPSGTTHDALQVSGFGTVHSYTDIMAKATQNLLGTTITFDIARKGDRTEVVFTHVGLKPAVECFDTCSDAWTSLIQGSLKELIETGKTELLELDAPAA